jgi:hypothetical protein
MAKITKEELIKKAKGKFQGVNHRCGPHKHKNDRRDSVKKEKSKKVIKESLDD